MKNYLPVAPRQNVFISAWIWMMAVILCCDLPVGILLSLSSSSSSLSLSLSSSGYPCASAFVPSLPSSISISSVLGNKYVQPSPFYTKKAFLFALRENDTIATVTTNTAVVPHDTNHAKAKIPIHLLTGFLGCGKTTTLKHILENEQDWKLGILVNDVASINIDAKLLATSVSLNNNQNHTNLIQLQNGCACCSLSDELLDSIGQLIQIHTDTSSNSIQFDAIIIELSGVADPVAIQNRWKEAVQQKLPITEIATMGNVITVLDATTFSTDYMTWDAVRDRKHWNSDKSNNNKSDDCGSNRKVVELLAEQTEAADVIVINKVDLIANNKNDDDDMTATPLEVVQQVATALNDRARIVTTTFGKVNRLRDLLWVDTVEKDNGGDVVEKDNDMSHATHHDDTITTHCDNQDCTDTSHSHTHSHHDNDTTIETCVDPDCNMNDGTDHSHTHSHHTKIGKDNKGEDWTTQSVTETCVDVDCTDTSHSHSHSHQPNTSTDSLGISNFVYKATRPFDAGRLMDLIYQWPIPNKDQLDAFLRRDDSSTTTTTTTTTLEDTNTSRALDFASPFIGVLRSKGFCWMAPSVWDGLLSDAWRHNTAFYWSHAGKHLGIQEAGWWWASVDRTRLYEFFATNPTEIERILQQDFVTEEFGDRRQELVFIGVDLNQKAIEDALNDCLLSDQELKAYRGNLQQLEQKILETQESAS